MRLTQTEISANLFSFHILTPLSSVMLTLCSLTRDFTVSTQPFLAAMCRGVVVCWTENRGTMDYQSVIKLMPNRILLITVIQDLLFIESPINLQVLLHLAVSYREVSPD